jgi:hypothetical protein
MNEDRDTDDASGLDLTGAWHGLYTYPFGRAPVAFVATLVESGSWLSGVTQETAKEGVAKGVTLSATLQGRRVGRSVTFLKTYDGLFAGYDDVSYAGALSADGHEIEGRWTIRPGASGGFLMIRPRGASVAVKRRAVARA